MAAGDISRGCDYLNRLISQTSMGSSGTDRRPTVIDGKYRKQNVQAVIFFFFYDEFELIY